MHCEEKPEDVFGRLEERLPLLIATSLQYGTPVPKSLAFVGVHELYAFPHLEYSLKVKHGRVSGFIKPGDRTYISFDEDLGLPDILDKFYHPGNIGIVPVGGRIQEISNLIQTHQELIRVDNGSCIQLPMGDFGISFYKPYLSQF